MSPGTMPGAVLDGQPRALEGKWLAQVTAVPLALLRSAWGQRLQWSGGQPCLPLSSDGLAVEQSGLRGKHTPTWGSLPRELTDISGSGGPSPP